MMSRRPVVSRGAGWWAVVLALGACAPAGKAPDARGDRVAAVAAASPSATMPARVSLSTPSPMVAATPSPRPAAATRWPADAPLRRGMARIRAATGALAHAQHGHLDRGQELALADEIQAAVEAMFAQCKLDPAPDAALHPLLARLLATSQELRARPADAALVADLRAILAEYDQLFEESAG